jgi:hypothetical protein
MCSLCHTRDGSSFRITVGHETVKSAATRSTSRTPGDGIDQGFS